MPMIDGLAVTRRAKVIKGEAFETCVRILRLAMERLVVDACKPASTTPSAVCATAIDVVHDVLSARADDDLLQSRAAGAADCTRTRAFFVYTFALIDYLEGS